MVKSLLQKLHAKLGDFWWYSILLFCALRCGDLINAVVGLWLVPKYVDAAELGAVMPLMQFSAFLGFPMSVLITVFSRFLAKFKARGEDGKVKSALRWFIGIAVIFNVAACIGSILFMPHFFERIRVARGSLGFLIIAAGLAAPLSLVFCRALQGLKKFNTVTIINLLTSPVRLATMLIALPIRALSGYMLGQTVPHLVTIAVAWYSLRKNVAKSVTAVSFWKTDGREMLRYFALTFLSLSIGSLGAFVLPVIIRQRMPEADSAAYYMITRFAELATYASMTLTFIMFPLASEAHEKGKDTLKLFINTSIGSIGFGLLASAALFFFGGWLLKLLPTSAPYAPYAHDMAFLALTLALGSACGNFTDYEFACNRFRFLWWNLPLTVIQTVFAVAFTGYNFFRGIFPDSVVDWMASLNLATLRNFIAMMFFTALIRFILIIVHLSVRHLRNRR